MPRTVRKNAPRPRWKRARRYRLRRYGAALVMLILLFTVVRGVSTAFGPTADPGGQAAMAPAALPQAASLPAMPPTAGTAQLQDAWIYGTHLGIEGVLPLAQGAAVPQSLQLVQHTEGGDISWPLQCTEQPGGLGFCLSQLINGGLELENLAEGSGGLLVRALASDGTTADYQLQATGAAAQPLTYYTVTHGGANRQVTLQPATFTQQDGQTDGILLQCATAPLPAEVYDIVIDPGHGGDDGGTINGDYCEADIALDIAKRTRDKLQALGLKVLLTRDGSEGNKLHMAYTMYDEDGRVNVTAAARAKLCLSLHLNSYEGRLDHGGVQIYAADKMDYSFAASLASNVVQCAHTTLSPMEIYSLGNGVYCRTFTEQDVADLAAEGPEHGFTSYVQPVGTNYYYMIRETGGRVTGAYVDGRHPHYGTNLYRDSAFGVETYLCELGYINIAADFNNLLTDPDGYASGLAQAVAQRFGF